MDEQTHFPFGGRSWQRHKASLRCPSDRDGFGNLRLRIWVDIGELLLWKEVIDASLGSGGVVGVGASLSWQLFFLFPWLQDDNLET